MQGVSEIGTLRLNGMLSSKPSPSRLRVVCEKGDRNIERARDGEWLQGNSIFQAQQSLCTYKLIETVTAYTSIYKMKLGKIPTPRRRCSTPNQEAIWN